MSGFCWEEAMAKGVNINEDDEVKKNIIPGINSQRFSDICLCYLCLGLMRK